MFSIERNSSFHLLFSSVAWKAEGSLTQDLVSVFRMAIFHEHRHETHRYQIHIPEPEILAFGTLIFRCMNGESVAWQTRAKGAKKSIDKRRDLGQNNILRHL